MRTPKPKTIDTVPSVVISKPRKRRSLRFVSLLLALIPVAGFLSMRFVLHYSELCKQSAEQKSQLEAMNEEVVRTRDQLSSETTLHSITASSHKGLATLHLSRLVGFAEYISENPSKARQVLQDALRFANVNGLDAKSVQFKIDALPKPRSLDSRAELKVLTAKCTQATAIVDVLASDLKQARIEGLGRADFEVTCDGREVPSFRVEPIHIAYGEHRVSVLVDCSGSILESFPDAKFALKSFVTEIADPWKVHVVSFASEVRTVSPWTHDASVHLQAIDSLIANGGTELFAAMELDAREHAKFTGTHTTVLLTDGKDSRGMANVSKILQEYQQTGTQLHVIALDRGEIDEPMLRRMASETKGTFQKIGQARELASLFKIVAQTMKRPVYRLTILGPIDRGSLSIQLAGREVHVPIDDAKLISAALQN